MMRADARIAAQRALRIAADLLEHPDSGIALPEAACMAENAAASIWRTIRPVTM
jgi:hypothetical protein